MIIPPFSTDAKATRSRRTGKCVAKQIHYAIGSGTEGDIPSLLDTTGIRIVKLAFKAIIL